MLFDVGVSVYVVQLIIVFGWRPDKNSGAIELTQVHTHMLDALAV